MGVVNIDVTDPANHPEIKVFWLLEIRYLSKTLLANSFAMNAEAAIGTCPIKGETTPLKRPEMPSFLKVEFKTLRTEILDVDSCILTFTVSNGCPMNVPMQLARIPALKSIKICFVKIG